MSTFVLVHGAWHGGWCWYKVTAALQARGHKVAAPDMPGHGTDRTPIETVTLDSIVERMCAAIDAQSEPVVLVGHSYGGTIITQTAERRPGRIRKLVYVTAFIVPDGQSTSEAAADDSENIIGPGIQYSADGRIATMDPSLLREGFYAQSPDEDVALARACLVPEALAGFQAKVHTTPENWGRIPRIFVECLKDKAIGPKMQRQLYTALPCERVFTLDTDHSPFFSMPGALTDILAGL